MIPSHVVSRLAAAATNGVSLRARRPRRGRERGAVLVHVAVAMMGLLAFSALSIDLGTLWVARGQAQNAVDAAALAGIVSLAANPEDRPVAEAAALTVAQQHTIWGETIAPATLTFTSTCPLGAPATSGECLNVVVERGNGIGSPLPVFFARVFGAAPTRVRASASAKVMTGNASNCVRPLGITDSWRETYPTSSPWTPDDQFERYADAGTIPPGVADTYEPPTDSSPGTGFTVAAMNGQRVTLRRPANLHGGVLAADNYVQLELPRADGATGDEEALYRANLATCSGLPVSIGEPLTAFDNHSEATNEPLQGLIDLDPGATWDSTTRTVRSGLGPGVGPRVIVIAVIDPDDYARQPRPSIRIDVRIRNLVGFFVESVVGEGEITGRIMIVPGMYDAGAPLITSDAAFLRNVALVR